MRNYTNQLNEDSLRVMVPSVFSTSAKETMSSQYAVIPTIECVRGLAKEGFHPVKAFESRCRDKENAPYVKHLIRFRHENDMNDKPELPEVIMINSHNGQSSYQLRAGIYRVVCSNGLIVGDELMQRRVVHKGDVVSKVVQAVTEIIEIAPKALEVIDEWKGLQLNYDEKMIFARCAALLKWDDDKKRIFTETIIDPVRRDDMGNDLWTIFNVVQERIMKGGIRLYDRETRIGTKSRAVNSVSENARLNTSLWELAESMARLKKTA